MASIRIGTTVQILHVIDLGDVVGDQSGQEGHHPRIHGGRCGAFDGFSNLSHGLIGSHGCRGCMQFPGAKPTVEHHFAVTARGMNTDRIGIGVEADQEKINGSTAAEAVFHRLTEIQQSLMTSRSRQFIVAAMGSAALVGGVEGTEVVSHHLQIAGWFGGGIRSAFAIAAMLCFDPTIHRVFHIKHGAGMGASTHSAEGNAQGVGHGVRKAPVSTGGQIKKMNAAVEQELFKLSGGITASGSTQGVVLEKAVAEQAMAFKNTPREQGAHVERTHPSPLKDVIRQVETEFCPAKPLGLGDEIGFMLQR